MKQEEKLQAAQKLYKTANADQKYVLESLFPELRESEDERIRKNLIELFHDTVSNDEIFSDYGLDKTKVLAWLEKQGEKPTLNEEDEKIKEGIINYFECQSRDEPTRKDIHNKWITWLKKQDEHKKQVHFPKFTFDDVLALQCCMETVKKVQEDKELYKQLNLIHNKMYDTYWLEKQSNKPQGKTYTFEGKSVLEAINKIGETKEQREQLEKAMADAIAEMQVARSEDDEKMVNNILTPLAVRYPFNIYQPMYNWLKSLKQRIGG